MIIKEYIFLISIGNFSQFSIFFLIFLFDENVKKRPIIKVKKENNKAKKSFFNSDLICQIIPDNNKKNNPIVQKGNM